MKIYSNYRDFIPDKIDSVFKGVSKTIGIYNDSGEEFKHYGPVNGSLEYIRNEDLNTDYLYINEVSSKTKSDKEIYIIVLETYEKDSVTVYKNYDSFEDMSEIDVIKKFELKEKYDSYKIIMIVREGTLLGYNPPPTPNCTVLPERKYIHCNKGIKTITYGKLIKLLNGNKETEIIQ